MNKKTVLEILNISEDDYSTYIDYINQSDADLIVNDLPFFDSKEVLTSISLYSLYPILFENYFEFTDQDLKEIITASHYHFATLFIIDEIFDTQQISESMFLLILLTYHKIHIKNLEASVNKFPDIKSEIEKYYLSTKAYLFKEKYVFDYSLPLSIKEIENYCSAKYSYAKIAILIYSKYSKKETSTMLHKQLLKSHDYFAIARQLIDDMEDYEEDISEDSYNIYLNYFFESNDIQTEPYFENKIGNTLHSLALEYYEKALMEIEFDKDSGWYRYVSFYYNEAKTMTFESIDE